MNCPSCGARNPPDAAWCTQCFTQFGADAAPPAGSAQHGDDRDAGGPATAGADRAAEPRPEASSGSGRDVRLREGVVEWHCRTCSSWNPLLAGTCAVCGSVRRGFGDRPTSGQTGLGGSGIVATSLLLPGLGHLLAGQVGSGLARAVLAVLWLGGGVALVIGGEGRGTWPGWLLVFGAALLWAGTAIDARRLAAGRRGQLLDTRGLAGLVVLVTGLLVVAVLLAAPV